ncbi:OmpA/MotB family protein [Formosa agariphila KMM 3901]|uniref:OmpA/MotB family protein n=1 Tax=Formosa agariphila (strain DSM 15362 / KCTC 12365 / LMG 23005 / KMM 3901 / M-2Alg 35-1) TaxID=1347342 RepID=T2KLN3_FORAG|nr:DUF937 domain-containing protein [Formosa agariphila]CDF79665.1 OmpA/MotB family protein [Formosa agariphila KMM 3901]
METNLLKSLSNYVTPELISQASSALGESETGISSAMSSAIPTLLSGLLTNANDTNVIDGIIGLANSKDFDASSVLSSLPSLLSDSGNKSAIAAGSGMLNMLFGNKQSGLFDLLGSTSGVKKSSVSRLMMMAAPMILGYIRKSGFSAGSLVKTLFSQKDDILKAAPTGLQALLGHGTKLKPEVKEKIKDIKRPVTPTPPPAKQKNKWILPFLIAVAALLIFYLLRNCEGEPETPVVRNNVPVVVEETKVDVIEPKVDLVDVTLPNGTTLNATANGLESQLTTWLANTDNVLDKNTWFDFDNLLFATASANLLPESENQLSNLVEILKAYPNVAIKIGGYTDNTGDPAANLKLSEDRAKSVVAEMVAKGIDSGRLSAEGYGQQHPVATNETEEGRAQNRRIAMRVTSK